MARRPDSSLMYCSGTKMLKILGEWRDSMPSPRVHGTLGPTSTHPFHPPGTLGVEPRGTPSASPCQPTGLVIPRSGRHSPTISAQLSVTMFLLSWGFPYEHDLGWLHWTDTFCFFWSKYELHLFYNHPCQGRLGHQRAKHYLESAPQKQRKNFACLD